MLLNKWRTPGNTNTCASSTKSKSSLTASASASITRVITIDSDYRRRAGSHSGRLG
ncbi:hypothetical protein B0H12DRAFT_1145191 [Mycena haematopus]|nr:hypothetical protein B0H12DRAFT_1145191 [Mycena haematopus]